MTEDNYSQSKTDWVEFIGPSGVGKSTLYEETIKIRNDDDHWLTDEEALDEIAKKYLSENRAVLSYRSYIKQFLKIISPLHEYRAYDAISNTLRNISAESLSGKYDFLCEHLIQFQCRHNELESHKKLAFLSWFYVNRLRDFMVIEYFPVYKIIVHGDGILHNISGIGSYDMDLLEVDNHQYSKFNYLPTGLIYCTTDESVILERMKQKDQSGLGTIIQKGMNDARLIEFIKREVKLSRAKIDFFRERGVAVLAIDTSDDLQENSKVVNNFIGSLTPRFIENSSRDCPLGKESDR